MFYDIVWEHQYNTRFILMFDCFTDPGVESECESEINRQMLRRNKELEDCIKFQRETLQDQAMRIEVKLRILFRDQI